MKNGLHSLMSGTLMYEAEARIRPFGDGRAGTDIHKRGRESWRGNAGWSISRQASPFSNEAEVTNERQDLGRGALSIPRDDPKGSLPVVAGARGELSQHAWDPGEYVTVVRGGLVPLSLLPLRFRRRFRERAPLRSLWEFRKGRSQPRDGLPYMVVPSSFAIFANTPALSSPGKKPPASSAP